MSHDTPKLLSLAAKLEFLATADLVATATKKEKKKLDPKAKVRNRGTVCVPAASAKDKKDHFPINDEGQARSALSRVEGLTSAPWYNGSSEGLRALVKRKVHSKYPSIGKGDKKKKSASEFVDALMAKYAQDKGWTPTAPSLEQGPPTRTVENDEVKYYGPGELPERSNHMPANVAPVAKKFPAIDPIFQTMLGVGADAQLGPQTRAALDRYKTSRNPGMSDAMAFAYLQKEPEYASRSAMQYDDNSNTYTKRA